MPVCNHFSMYLIDIHSHILPYVDDGAMVFEVTEELLERMFQQGTRIICCTPHLRKGMFETPDEEVIRQFQRVCTYVQEHYGKQLKLLLSREYHFDQLFREKLTKGEILPLGKSRHLLLEFSRRHTLAGIQEAVQYVQSFHYVPVIAHVERYAGSVCSPEGVRSLIQLGAKIQINASAVIGRGGYSESSVCKKLLKEDLVHAIASDAHDPEDRPPELEKASIYLNKKYEASLTEALFYRNPIQMLRGEEQ